MKKFCGNHVSPPLWLGPLFLSIVTLLAACSKGNTSAAPEAADAPRPALVQTAEPTPDTGTDVLPGEVRARYETEMGFRIPGKIAAREVEVGTVVKAGSVLARLDPVDVALQASQAEARFVQADADIRRARDLRAKNFISQSALDASETAFRAAESQVGLARNQGSYAVLRADRAGVVTAVNAEPGQVVAAGQTVVRLAQTSVPEIVINVPENRLRQFRATKKITVVLWAVPGKHYEGSVRELSPVADAATRTFNARISVLRPDADVQLGMTANVVLGERGQDVFMLPLPALTRVKDKPVVWVVDAATKVVAPREVSLAEYRSEDRVAVAGGIKAGDLVVIAGVHKLIAGQKVQPVQAPKSAP